MPGAAEPDRARRIQPPPDASPSAQRPLESFARLHSADSSRVELVTGEAFSPHRMGVDRGGRLDARLHSLDIGSVRLIYLEYDAAVSIVTSCPLDYYAVNLPLVGAARIQARRVIDVVTNASQAAVFSPADHAVMRLSEDLRQLCVRIEARALREHTRMLTPHRLPSDLRFDPVLFTSRGEGAAWTQVLNLALATVDRCGRAGVPAPLARQLEQMVMSTLLLTQPSSCSEALHSPVSAVGQAAVRAVAERMRAEPETVSSVAEAAAAVQVSVRTLQEGFRRHFGMSPGHFLAEARLDRARQIIEEEMPVAAHVADVAYRVGYMHLGRFAERYRERFGVTPSEALRARRS
ncbi:AraC family transcriptional regulator [Streptomyces sioyaensis]|uniref:AraC family transcriptional regulator n=1 Tax=Streptomyces sioyaensis TaxID=67364 RepID=UPI0036B09C0C